jgi:uncharacterized coiled-coil DUF342 family protein
MTRQLADQLFHILRGASQRESLGRLRREGHRKVAVLRFADIEVMLGQAIEQALESVGVELDEETLGALNAEARARLLALRSERDELRLTVEELTRQQKELTQNRNSLRNELHQAETELVERQQAALDPEAEADLGELRKRLGDGLRELLAGSLDERQTDQAVALALAAVDAHREAAIERQQRQHDARVDQLRRRIDRLRHKLGESETLLARAREAARQNAQVVVGTEPVQPSAPLEDPSRRRLLEEIFNLNVELRRMTVQLPKPTVTVSSPPAEAER